jgi:hypothetical protein
MQRNDRLDSTSSESFRVNDQYVHVEASQQPAHPDWLYLDAWERRQAQTTFVDSGGYSGRWLNGKFEFYSGQFDLQQHPGAAAAKDNGRGTVFSDALRRCAVQSIGRIQEGISPLRGGEHVDDHQWRGYSEKPSDHNQDLYARFDSRESEQYYERWYQGGYSGELSSSQASPGFLATSVTASAGCATAIRGGRRPAASTSTPFRRCTRTPAARSIRASELAEPVAGVGINKVIQQSTLRIFRLENHEFGI